MNSQRLFKILMTLCEAAVIVVALLLSGLTVPALPVYAQQGPDMHYVAPGGACGDVTPCYGSVQAAVDAAAEGVTIKVATGVYTALHGRLAPPDYTHIITQVVFISKTVTLQGGYAADNWTDADPEANPTTLDALGQGRVLYVDGGDPGISPTQRISPTIEGLRITGGDTGLDAGGGGVTAINAAVTLSNTLVFSNAARYWGGGVYLSHSPAILRKNTITANYIRDGLSDSGGGGVYMLASPAVLVENTIVDNWAQGVLFEDGVGGAVHMVSSAAILERNVISNNRACSAGGLYGYESPAHLIENTIVSNTAEHDGGGLFFWDSAPTLSGNTIASNLALGEDWWYGGGGVFLQDSDGTVLRNNTIRDNRALGSGGGIDVWHSEAALVAGNMLLHNTAGHSGGALALSKSVVTLRANVMEENVAAYGGGLSMGESEAMLEATVFRANRAERGGALGVYQSAATLMNTALVHNQAETAGDGVLAEGSKVSMSHVTLVGNGATTTGEGSGIHLRHVVDGWGVPLYSTARLSNSVLVNHTVGISAAQGSAAYLRYGLLHGNADDFVGTRTVENPVGGRPVLAADGYHLRLGSAALDRGIDTDVTHDIDGDARIHGAGPDLGADELRFALVRPDAPATLVYVSVERLTVTLEIPAGAVAEPTVLAYVLSEAVPAPPGAKTIGYAFDLLAYRAADSALLPEFTFSSPVTITARYRDHDMATVVDEVWLWLGWWTERGWEDAISTCVSTSYYAPLYERDLAQNSLAASICRTGRFALFGPTHQVYLPVLVRLP